MSLREVVLEIVGDMETEVADLREHHMDVSLGVVLSWAKQLRRVCKAAGDSESVAKKAIQEFLDSPIPRSDFSPLVSARRGTGRIPVDEPPDDDPDDLLRGQVSVPFVGGGSNGDHIVLSPLLPKDSSYKMTVNGEVYILKGDGKLHFSASETLAT